MSDAASADRPQQMSTTGWNRVLCLETAVYSGDFDDRTSVRPMLELLTTTVPGFHYVHRTVATRRELEWHLGRWRDEGDGSEAHYTLYLAFHGSRGTLHLPDCTTMGLVEIGDVLEGQLEGCVVHLGSCSVIDGPDDEDALGFLRRTEAVAVMGYSTDVDWNLSAAFDLLLLDRLGRYKQLKRIAEAPEVASLGERLGFHLVRGRRSVRDDVASGDVAVPLTEGLGSAVAVPNAGEPDVMGAAEAAEALGVGQTDLRTVRGLPDPIVKLRATSLWDGRAIRRLAAERSGPRRPPDTPG